MTTRPSRRYPASRLEHPPLALPAGKAIPFDWPVAPIPPDPEGLCLHWNKPSIATLTSLRFTLAIDLRVARAVEVTLAQSGYRLGICDVQYGYPLQTFEVPLAPNAGAAVLGEGVRLRLLDGSEPLWIMAGGEGAPEGSERLWPHLFDSGAAPAGEQQRWEAAFESLASLGSLQVFGWLEGCVLEGLEALAERVPAWRQRAHDAIRQHLDLFFPGDQMIYFSPRSERVVNRWNNNEHGLMMPTLLRHRPGHPAVALFKEVWIEYLSKEVHSLSRNLSCEGCYTLAYPIALLSSLEANPAWSELALDLLWLHQTHLRDGDTLHLQYLNESGTTIYPNWLRGIAWYLLGHARVLALTGCDTSPKARRVAEELRRAARWIVTLQREDGLWSCFAHQPETGVETSGSAGIAAALLLAHELGCSDASAVESAQRCFKGLLPYLSGDGLLSGVSQSNKGEIGEPLQRYGFRGYSQMGQGLAVQLAAIAHHGAGH